MNEDTLYSLIGRMFVDLRALQVRNQQLEKQVADLTKPAPAPPSPNDQAAS